MNNIGGADLVGLTFAVTGPFGVPSAGNACGTVLAKGATCTLQVMFSPSNAGAATGALSIASSNLSAPITVALAGTGVDFQIQVNGNSTATVTSGQSASYQIQFAPASGSAGTVNFACTGAPQYSTCTPNPASMTIASGTTGTVTVQVATGVTPSSATMHLERWRSEAVAVLLFCCVIPILGRRRSRAWLTVVAAIAICLVPTACGTSATGGGYTPPPPSKTYTTPSGTYTLTITATSAGLQRTTALTLNVE